MPESNNEISRDIMIYLRDKQPKAVKFVDLFRDMNVEERILFKNLFFLEETRFLQLMSSYPSGATYPTIHMVKLKEEGLSILDDEEKLDAMFPLKGFSSRLDISKINKLTIHDLLETLSSMLEAGEIDGGDDKEVMTDTIKKLSDNPALKVLTLGKVFEHYSS